MPIFNPAPAVALADDVPPDQAIGDTAVLGTSGEAAREDHKHGMPAAGTPVVQAEGDVASEGVAITLARSDHRHGMPSAYKPSPHSSSHMAGGADIVVGYVALAFIYTGTEITKVDPGVTYVVLGTYASWARLECDEFTQYRIIAYAGGNETGLGKGLKVRTAAVDLAEVTWDGAGKAWRDSGWSAVSVTGIQNIELLVKGSSATEDIEVYILTVLCKRA